MSELNNVLDEILLDKNTNLLPENLKQGITVLGVEGTLSSSNGVKLFKTIEEMQADTNANEGDLALVYDKNVNPFTAETVSNVIIFPKYVTLPEAVTADIYIGFNPYQYPPVEGVPQLNYLEVMPTMARYTLSYDSGGNSFSVSYHSEDGIHYTKGNTAFSINAMIKLDTEISFKPSDDSPEWNDIAGYFMKTGSYNFQGIYEYTKNTQNQNLITFPNVMKFTYDENNETTDDGYIYEEGAPLEEIPLDKLYKCIIANKDKFSFEEDPDATLQLKVFKSNNIYYLMYLTIPKGNVYWCTSINGEIGIYTNRATYINQIANIKVLTITDLETNTMSDTIENFDINLEAINTIYRIGDYIVNTPVLSIEYFRYEDSVDLDSTTGYNTCGVVANLDDVSTRQGKKYSYPLVDQYILAQTQLTMNQSSQLLNNVLAYSNAGIVKGTLELPPINTEEYNQCLTLAKNIAGISE